MSFGERDWGVRRFAPHTPLTFTPIFSKSLVIGSKARNLPVVYRTPWIK